MAERLLRSRNTDEQRTEAEECCESPGVPGLTTRWPAAILLLVAGGVASAQTLVLPNKIVLNRDRTAEFRVALSSNEAKLTALQWDIELPGGDGVGLSAFQAESKNHGQNKTLNCAVQRDSSAAHSVYRCILAGGRDAIKPGPIARFTLTTPKPGAVGAKFIRIQHAEGVTADLKRTDLPDTQAAVKSR